MFSIGLVFTILSTLISFYLAKISPRILVRKYFFRHLKFMTTLNLFYFGFSSYLANNFGCLFCGIEFYYGISYHCYYIHHLPKLQYMCNNNKCYLSQFVSNKRSSYSDLLNLYVRKSWWLGWNKFSWSIG